MKRGLLRALTVVATAVCVTAAYGGNQQGCADCSAGDQLQCAVCGACCAPECAVTKTIMCPMNITETHIEYVCETKTEEHEVPYTVFQRVPVKRQYKRECCYLADETKTKVVTWKECQSVNNPVTQTYTAQVPETETRVCTRTVCKCIDGEMVQVEETCPYDITVLRPEVRSRNCSKPDIVFQTKSDVITYCVKTPKKHTVDCAEETVYKLEPVEKTRKVSVCVPVKVPKPVDVTVCRMVPQTVICCPSCAASGCLDKKAGHRFTGEKCAEMTEKCADKCADTKRTCKKMLRCCMDKCATMKERCAKGHKRRKKACGKVLEKLGCDGLIGKQAPRQCCNQQASQCQCGSQCGG